MRLPRLVTASFATSALVLAGLTGCSSDGPGSASDIVIGIDYDKSSSVDAAYYRAASLRVDQVNASGRLGGHRLVLRALVSQSDPTTTLRDVDQFGADQSVAGAILGSCDACSLGAVKTAGDRSLPVIALSASDDIIGKQGAGSYVFKLGPVGSDASAALVDELQRRKQTSISILAADDTAGSNTLTDLKAALNQVKLAPKVIRTVKASATDLGEPMAALTTPSIKAMVVLGGPEQALLATKSARATGWKGDIYFGAAAAGDLFVPSGDTRTAEGTTMVFTQTLAIDDVIATTPAKAARKQWFRDYTSRWGSYNGNAAFAADAVDLIADAAVKANGSRTGIRDILETSQTDGLSGPIRMTPDNHSGLMPQAMTLLVVRAGRWRLES